MPSLEKCPNRCLKKRRLFGKYVEHCFRKGMKPFPALAPLQLGEMRSMRQSSNGDMAHSNSLKEG